jgi:uncharacterized protein (DUF433 family)
MTFERISVDPEICGGQPCLRGLRFPVSRLLGLLAAGETPESILQSYPYLEVEDIEEALAYRQVAYREARGMLRAGPSLTDELLAERARELERKEAKNHPRHV